MRMKKTKMNRAIVLLAIMFGFVQMGFSQQNSPKDSSEVYDYWGKRGIIEVVYCYMEAYIDDKNTKNPKNEIEGKNKYSEEFIKEIDKKDSLPKFDEISDLLKNNSWEDTKKKLFVPLKDNFEAKNSFKEIFCNNKTNLFINKYKTLDDKIGKILLNYNKAITELKKNPSTEKQTWFKPLIYGSFLLTLLTGLIIGGWLIYIILRNKIYSILNESEEKKECSSKYSKAKQFFGFKYLFKCIFKCIYPVYDLKEKNKSLEKELEKELETHKKELDKRKKDESEKRQNKIEGNTSSNHKNIYKVKEQPKKVAIFFTMPESDGSFQVLNGKSLYDRKRYFRVEHTEASNRGDLFFIYEEGDQRVINRSESYLKPVCDIVNISKTSTKIELVREGKVFLEGDRWRIDPDNKIKIKLY